MKCAVHHQFFQIFSGFGFPVFLPLKAAHKIHRIDLIKLKISLNVFDSRIKILFYPYFTVDSLLAQTNLQSVSRRSPSEPWLAVLLEVSPFPGFGHPLHLAMYLDLSQGFILSQYRRILSFLETKPSSKSQAPHSDKKTFKKGL